MRAVKLRAGNIERAAQHLYGLELFCDVTPLITLSVANNELESWRIVTEKKGFWDNKEPLFDK